MKEGLNDGLYRQKGKEDSHGGSRLFGSCDIAIAILQQHSLECGFHERNYDQRDKGQNQNRGWISQLLKKVESSYCGEISKLHDDSLYFR